MAGVISGLQRLFRKIRVLRDNLSGKKIIELENRLLRQEELLNTIVSDEASLWLYQNREERMDATMNCFDEKRRQFHLERYRFACSQIKNMVVADIACGTGYGSRVLMEEGQAKSVTGIDINQGAIKYAEKKHKVDGVVFKAASADHTEEVTGFFDAVISFETIEHVPDDHAMLDEFARMLKLGGLLVCSTPNGWPIDLSQHHLRTYDMPAISQVLGKNFKVEKFYNQNSGSDFIYNHKQPAGIIETNELNYKTAECYIVICRRK